MKKVLIVVAYCLFGGLVGCESDSGERGPGFGMGLDSGTAGSLDTEPGMDTSRVPGTGEDTERLSGTDTGAIAVDTGRGTETAGDLDTGTQSSGCVATMVGPVARGSGVLALEFADCEHTWLFTAQSADGGVVTGFSIDGHQMLTNSSVNGDNYGSIFWVSPQSIWGWPPPYAMNDAPYNVVVDEVNFEIELSRSDIAVGGTTLEIRKLFSVDLAKKGVRLSYTMANRGSASVSVAPWEVTRVYPDGLTFFPMGEGSVTSGSFAMYPNVNQNGVVWCDHGLISGGDNKLFADGAGGWLAHTDGQAVLVKNFEDMVVGAAAPGEAEVELYGNASYEEVEAQGAVMSVAPGTAYTWSDVLWRLRPMPDGATATVGDSALLSLAEALSN